MTSVPGLFFDWFGDGFGAHPENDCTALLRSAAWQRGGTPEITGAAQAGSATFTLRNVNGLFDPDNASGALYGRLRDGVRVWFGANEDGTLDSKGATVRGRFAGRVTDISPLPVAGAGDSTPDVEIVCEDALGWYGRTPVELSRDCSPPGPTCASSVGAAVLAHITDQVGASGSYAISVTPSGRSAIVAGFVAGGTGMSLSSTSGFTTLYSYADTGHETLANGWASASSAETVTASYAITGNPQAAVIAAFATSASAPLQTAVGTWPYAGTKHAVLASPPTPGNLLVGVVTGSENSDPMTIGRPLTDGVRDLTLLVEGQCNGVHPFGGAAVGIFAGCVESGWGTDWYYGGSGAISDFYSVTLMEWAVT